MSNFKQIKSILGTLKDQKNVRHLSFLKRFTKRMQNNVVESLGANCPQKLQKAYQLLAQKVVSEDEVYLVSQKSELTAQIDDWDKKRDNTYVGIRTLAEALQRIGTAEQQEAAAKVLGRIGQHKIDVNERYEDEGEKLEQLVQDLQGPLATETAALGLTAQVATLKEQNDQTEHYLELRQNERADQSPQAMKIARDASNDAYELMVTLINAYAIVEESNGTSPYDTCISYVNSDIKYYEDHVFNKKDGSGGGDVPDVEPEPQPSGSGTEQGGSGSEQGGTEQGGSGSGEGGGTEHGGSGSGEGGSDQGGGVGTITPGGDQGGSGSGGSGSGDSGGSGDDGGGDDGGGMQFDEG